MTTDAPAADPADLPPRPDVHTPRNHPDVRGIEAKLREVRAEIKPLEKQRQEAREERQRIENERRKARENDDYDALTRLTLEEDQIQQLGEQEHERLLDLHTRAMRLTEKREEVRRRVVPEIEDAIEEWAAPRLQALANACQRALDLYEELAPAFDGIRDHNHSAQLPGSDHAPVHPSSVMFVTRAGGLKPRSTLNRLREAGYEPETDPA